MFRRAAPEHVLTSDRKDVKKPTRGGLFGVQSECLRVLARLATRYREPEQAQTQQRDGARLRN